MTREACAISREQHPGTTPRKHGAAIRVAAGAFTPGRNMSTSKELIFSSQPAFAGWMEVATLALAVFACGRTRLDPKEAAAARGELAARAPSPAHVRAEDSIFTTIDFPGARMTNAFDINSAGDIVGDYANTEGGKTRGYLLSRGAFTKIDVPFAVLTGAWGINDRGQIVGRYQKTSDPNPNFHGFLLSEGNFTSIDFSKTFTRAHGINARGDIVGRYDDDLKRRHGFLLSERTGFVSFDFPGAIDTAPWGINPTGDIAGRYSSADGKSHAFLLSEGEFTSIDFPGAVETAPLGVPSAPVVKINPRGDIVGSYCDAEPCSLKEPVHGFLLRNEGEFTSIDFPGAIRTATAGISPRGDIVGAYVDRGGRTHGFLLSKGETTEDAHGGR
jgi:uncharacterized membrane protein